MRIAVCIENNEIRRHLRLLLNQYGVKNDMVLDCRFLKNDIELLCDLAGGEYDAIFLDFVQNIGGLIAEIRQKDKLVRLIPIVEVSQWVAAEYKQDIWYCLPAPVLEPFLFAVLDRLISDYKQDTEAGIVIKSRKGIVRLVFSRLEYVEVLNKTVCFHMSDGQMETVSASLAEYEARLLHWPDFIKVHRAYIVNLRYVQKLSTGGIVTDSGHSIPVSRYLYPQLKKDYMNKLMDPAVNQEAGEAYFSTAADGEGGYLVLLVDDEEQERTRWTRVLTEKGCKVVTANSGKEALRLIGQAHFHCVVLDVRLGQDSGFDICSDIQEQTSAPVVFLSILSDHENQSKGFLSGGIDYITKDTTDELFWLKVEARIKMSQVERAEISDRNLRIDLKGRRVFLTDREVSLTTVEFDLLCLLMRNAGAVYTPAQLYGMVWGAQQWDDGQTVQLHLSQLRRKLEHIYSNHIFIETVWGRGYCFVSEKEGRGTQK